MFSNTLSRNNYQNNLFLNILSLSFVDKMLEIHPFSTIIVENLTIYSLRVLSPFTAFVIIFLLTAPNSPCAFQAVRRCQCLNLPRTHPDLTLITILLLVPYIPRPRGQSRVEPPEESTPTRIDPPSAMRRCASLARPTDSSLPFPMRDSAHGSPRAVLPLRLHRRMVLTLSQNCY